METDDATADEGQESGGRQEQQQQEKTEFSGNSCDYCVTADCVETSHKLMQYIDPSVDPCEDFFDYACGRFEKVHTIPEDKAACDTFSLLKDDLELKLFDLLEDPIKEDDIEATRKAKDLYKSCMNEEMIETRGNKPLLDLLDELGGWPVLDPEWSGEGFDWLDLTIKLRHYNNDILIQQWVGADGENSSVNIIQLDQTDLGMPSREYYLSYNETEDPSLPVEKKEQVAADNDVDDGVAEQNATAAPSVVVANATTEADDELAPADAYRKFMLDVTVLLGADPEFAVAEMRDTFQFETRLAKMTIPHHLRRDFFSIYKKMRLAELIENVTEIDWLRYLNSITPFNITEDELVVVYAMDYYKKLAVAVEETPPRVIANYLLWRFVKHRVGNMGSEFIRLKQEYQQVLLGTMTESSRWSKCVSYINENFGMAVGAMFVRKHFQTATKEQSVEIIRNLRETFEDMLKESVWMDDSTKSTALKKARGITEKIGYPDFIMNATLLNAEFVNYNVHPDKYFENILENLKAIAMKEQKNLRHPVDKNRWTTDPAVINAYYSRPKNQIMFPAGILQPPFYSPSYPMSMNYGGIGMVIGHEITHGFDDKGKQFDADGNLLAWWSDEAIVSFQEKAQCMIDQYGNYTIEEVQMNINGKAAHRERTLRDNGGFEKQA
ncbi:PREDICTED: membrane metallo-endopeptidase-like 1 [Priapulus caudatus]|uniref:Membrane metallo-endopeptidase-like 1 n=1 Tax=Priapulus caudatus TaxID=37621 RepID=A0ABM1EYM9_PRICU|nr:PREDICTED: membrane metallo-endopeptidase-like 1 [Priapulus caudatus]